MLACPIRPSTTHPFNWQTAVAKYSAIALRVKLVASHMAVWVHVTFRLCTRQSFSLRLFANNVPSDFQAAIVSHCTAHATCGSRDFYIGICMVNFHSLIHAIYHKLSRNLHFVNCTRRARERRSKVSVRFDLRGSHVFHCTSLLLNCRLLKWTSSPHFIAVSLLLLFCPQKPAILIFSSVHRIESTVAMIWKWKAWTHHARCLKVSASVSSKVKVLRLICNHFRWRHSSPVNFPTFASFPARQQMLRLKSQTISNRRRRSSRDLLEQSKRSFSNIILLT